MVLISTILKITLDFNNGTVNMLEEQTIFPSVMVTDRLLLVFFNKNN